jgi:hypothetical protein
VGARSVPAVDVEPPSDDDAYGLQLKQRGDMGGASKEEDLRRFFWAPPGALRAPILHLSSSKWRDSPSKGG